MRFARLSGGPLDGEIMPRVSSLYTFVFEYAGGTYLSQYRGRTHREALSRWLKSEPRKLESLFRFELADRLASQLDEWHEPVEIDGIANAWCWTALLPKGLALVNYVKTVA